MTGPLPRAVALAGPDEAQALTDRIQRFCGLRIDGHKLIHALASGWDALARMGVADVGALLRQLPPGGGGLWPTLLPYLTVNETYFMREADQLADFVAIALPELRARAFARGGFALEVLSAACSTGEEAYTLAGLMREARTTARVLGIDLDPVALTRAAAGVYGPGAFRAVDAAWRESRFDALGPTAWSVRAAARGGVAFEPVNLLGVEAALAGRRFDAIFCRNALIYFDRPTQLDVIRQLRAVLHPGGFLALGHSEMFFGVDLGLEVVRGPGSTLYRRPERP